MKARKFFLDKYGEPTDFTSRFALKVLEDFEKETADYTIDVLGLENATYNALKRSGLTTVSAIKKTSDKALLLIRGFGKKALIDLRTCIEKWEQSK